MTEFFCDLFDSLFKKEKTAVISTLSQKDFNEFRKNSAKAAKEANEEFQFNHGGPSHDCIK